MWHQVLGNIVTEEVLLYFCTPFILVQNFMLIIDHMEMWAWKSMEMTLLTFQLL